MQYITELLDAWAADQPDKKLFGFVGADGSERDAHSYARFAAVTRGLARWLREQGLQSGDRAILAFPPGLDMITAFFACARAGIIAVPTARPPGVDGKDGARRGAALARLEAIAVDCAACVVLTDRTPLDVAAGGLRWLATKGLELARTDEDTPSDILFLQYTSGATGNPRGVVVSHENVMANARAILGHMPVGTRHVETGVSWLPQHHDMGLIGYYLFPVIVGGTTIGLSPLDFLRKPALWLQIISRERGTYASSPDFGFERCLDKISDEELAGVDLASLHWLMSGAEPVRPATLERFIARFAPFGLRAAACGAAYGLAENTLAATHHGRRSLALDAVELRRSRVRPAGRCGNAVRIASCGTPLDGVDLRIVDPASRCVLGDRSIGEVWLAGPSVCAGYWGVSAATCETFGQRLAEPSSSQSEQWLRTGDLGFIDRGEVFICGRRKDVIIVRGANHHPQDIEAAVEEVRGVRANSAAAFSTSEGALAVMVETPAGRPLPDPAKIARAVEIRCQVLPQTVVLVQPGSIVRTTSGKLARLPTRERFVEGAIPVLQAWDAGALPAENDALAALRTRLDALLKRLGPAAQSASLGEAGLDSLALTELLLSLEDVARRQGAHRLAKEFDLPMLQRLGVARLRRLLDELDVGTAATLDPIGDDLRRVRNEAAAGIARRMRDDARLEPLTTQPASADVSAISDALLTGVTGFFGPFLIESLLRQTGWRFRVLVRAEGADHARQRVRNAMAETGLLARALANGLESRVDYICGDIALPDWGLDRRIWQRLAGDVQAVIHNAAAVNWVANYETLRPANVEGTRTMIRFALSERRKRLHHISTTFIFGWTAQGMLLETDSNDEMAELDFGYAQTKWVAEQLVLAARREGVDARIYRPAIVSASTAGMGHPADVAVRVLAFMINHGIAVQTANQLSILPADVAAENIAAIIAQDDPPARTFHVTTDYYNIVDLASVLTAEHGYHFTHYDIPGFIAEMNRRCTKDDPLYPLLDFFNGSAARIAAMQLKRYSNTAYRQACMLGPGGRADPALSATVASIVSYLRRQGFVRRQPETA